jgi:type IV pilus assembly protein PilA
VIEAIQRRMAARRSDEDRQGGFTLIELMVVVMIIAILIGIAIPAFLGARKRAQDTGAKSNLRNALSSATAIFSDNQTYPATADMVTALAAEEPSLSFVNNSTDSTTSKIISVETGASVALGTSVDMVVLASASKSGKCYFLRHVNTPGQANSGSYQAETATNAACSADDAPDPLLAAGWTAL